jgi:hypothetical protein
MLFLILALPAGIAFALTVELLPDRITLAAVNFGWSGQAAHAALLIAGMLIVLVVLLQLDHESRTQGC